MHLISTLRLCRVLRGLIALMPALLTAAFAQASDDVEALVLANATLIDGAGAAARPNVSIVIVDGKISEIIDGTPGRALSRAADTDLSGRWILPGLIDTHVHVSLIPDAQATLRKLADAGITTVRDMGGDARTLAVLARDAQSGTIRTPNVYYSALLYGPTWLQDRRSHDSAHGIEPGSAPWSRVVTRDSDLRAVIAEAQATGATGLKVYADIEASLLRDIVREAHRWDLKVWSHATIYPSKPSDAVKAGVDVISHSGGLYAEARSDVPSSYTEAMREWLPKQDFGAVDPWGPPFDELFALMRHHGTLLDPTITILRRGANAVPRRPHAAALSEWACEATRAAHASGVTIVAGTDSNPRLRIPLATELEALVECGLSPLDAIQAATFNAARTLGIEATHGTVEVGKIADLVILAANPLENIANVREVVATVQSGRLYHLEEGEAEAE